MAKTKYYIQLTDAERSILTKIVCEQRESERTVMRAKILLMSETAQAEKISIKKLAEILGTTDTTIQTVRTEYSKDGIQAAIYRKPISPGSRTGEKKHGHKQYKRRIDDETVKQIRELVAGQPPEGFRKWSTRLICKEAMEKGIVEHIAPVTVGKILNREAPYGEK